MKIQITKKILILLIIILIIFMCFPIKVNALSDILQSGETFLSKGQNPSTVIDETKLQSTSKTIYQILMVIAIIVAVIIGAVLGVKFIFESVEGKAKIQEALIPYIAGCIVIFGSFFIWKTVINVGNKTVTSNFEDTLEYSSERVAIGDGTVNVSDLTDDDLKIHFAPVKSELDTLIKGTKNDSRSGGLGEEGIPLEDAVKKLSKGYRKIYDECKKRGLIEEYTTTYIDGFNGEKTATFVRLKQ